MSQARGRGPESRAGCAAVRHSVAPARSVLVGLALALALLVEVAAAPSAWGHPATTVLVTSQRGSPPAASDVARGPNSLRLVSQSFWAGPGPGEFKVQLQVTATDPADETLAVLVYGALSARSQFQAALGGTEQGTPVYDPGAVALGKLPANPEGGVDVDIPIGTPTGAPWPPSSTGVYPVQIFLQDPAGARVGQPLNTFLVYVGSDAAGFEHLRVSLVVPLATKESLSATGTPGKLAPSAATVMEADAGTLDSDAVPVTLQPNVPTLEALQADGRAGRTALSRLQAAVAGGDEVLPATGLPINVGSFQVSGFSGDLTDELGTGQAALASLLGSAPPFGTWAFPKDVGPSTLAAMVPEGVTRAVVPEADLANLPVGNQGLTFAEPVDVGVSDHQVEVLGADTELAGRVSQAVGANAVLVGDQVLAELAMIDLERPSDMRGVVVMPPLGTLCSPTFLSVLLHGLVGNPLLQAVTVEQLFDQVPPAPSTGTPVTLADERPAPPLAGVGQLLSARHAVTDLAEVYGSSLSLVTDLDERLVTSLSSWFSTAQRARIISGVLATARSELFKVRMPRAISITLTARQGKLPLTLVTSGPTPMKVRLVMTSEQLSFVARRLAQGTCRALYPGSEACELTLDRATVTLAVPVIVRTPGAFPLTLAVQTPDGSVQLSSSTDTVRATALSAVGLGLMIGAAVFLGVWWARNARHGRRARKLVPRPLESDGEGEGPGAAPAHPVTPA